MLTEKVLTEAEHGFKFYSILQRIQIWALHIYTCMPMFQRSCSSCTEHCPSCEPCLLKSIISSSQISSIFFFFFHVSIIHSKIHINAQSIIPIYKFLVTIATVHLKIKFILYIKYNQVTFLDFIFIIFFVSNLYLNTTQIHRDMKLYAVFLRTKMYITVFQTQVNTEIQDWFSCTFLGKTELEQMVTLELSKHICIHCIH